MGSPPFSLDKTDFWKIAEGAAVAAVGAALTYVSTQVLPTLHPANMSQSLIFVVFTVLVRTGLSYFTDTRPPTT